MKQNGWYIEYNETNEIVKRDYFRMLLTKELLEELISLDDRVYQYNVVYGCDKYGNYTSKHIGYAKVYLEKIEDGKLVDKIRLDLGDGWKINKLHFQKLEEELA